MKVIHREDNGRAIAILDENNYGYGRLAMVKDKNTGDFKETMLDTSYFNSIEHAVAHACRLRANKECGDLSDWLEKYRTTFNGFKTLMEIS